MSYGLIELRQFAEATAPEGRCGPEDRASRSHPIFPEGNPATPEEYPTASGQESAHLVKYLAFIHSPDRAMTSCEKGGLPSWKAKKIDRFIVENLAEKISVQRLARLVGLSESHLQRAFATSFGISPHRYVINKRLAVARTLLVSTDWPIKFIALECGMADQSHFTRVMKRFDRATPAAVRRGGRAGLNTVSKVASASASPVV